MSIDNSAQQDRGSVTRWLDQLRHLGEDQWLEQEIWNRYFSKLAEIARRKLSADALRVVDGEDVALSALNSFFANFRSGRYERLSDRGQLWKLLATIATYKAINTRVREGAKKRGGGMVHNASAIPAEEALQFVATDPGPQQLVEFQDLVTQLMEQLDLPLRRIARGKLMDQSDWEIANELGVSPRTIARKVARIGSIWSRQLDESTWTSAARG